MEPCDWMITEQSRVDVIEPDTVIRIVYGDFLLILIKKNFVAGRGGTCL